MAPRMAVLTSGGDAPGQNAAIRAVVRTAIAGGAEVLGVRHGFGGLMEGDFTQLGSRDVSGIIQRGGTILGSGRYPEFASRAGIGRALRQLRGKRVDGLVVIGGDGSQRAAYDLSRAGVAVMGLSSTIDNDLLGCDITLGVDTALNVALEAIDRLKNTASAHHRAFLVETMGRQSGYLALMAGIAGGAEVVVIPERELSPAAVAAELRAAYERGKSHAIAVVAEGARNDADELMEYFRHQHSVTGFELRVTRLGHVQRGGEPGAFDRTLGSRLGFEAATGLLRGQRGCMVGLQKGQIVGIDLEQVAAGRRELDPSLLDLAHVLAQ
jgi:6-phosphofructokinase 1